MAKSIKFIIGILLLFVIFLIMKKQINIQQYLALISFSNLIVLCLISFAIFALLALQLFLSFHIFPPKIKIIESIHLTLNNSLANSILPLKTGLIFRWAYLKKQYSYPLSAFLSNTLTLQLLQFITSLALFTILSNYYIKIELLNSYYLLAVIIIFLLILAIFITFKPNLLTHLKFILSSLKNHQQPTLLIVLVQMVFISLSAFRLYLAAIYLNIDVNFFSIMLMQVILTIILFTNFTIGNLGVKEGGVYLISMSLGMQSESVVLAALLDRTVSLITVLTLGTYSTYWLKQQVKSS